MIPHIYLTPEHKHCILANMSYFHAQKYHSEIGCHNIKKRNWTMVWTPRYLSYMNMVKIHQQCLEHLPYWWCSGMGNNRIDIKWPKMHTLQTYLKCYWTHTRYAESIIKYLGINLVHKILDSTIAVGNHTYIWGVYLSAKCAGNQGYDAPSEQT